MKSGRFFFICVGDLLMLVSNVIVVVIVVFDVCFVCMILIRGMR